MADIITFDVDAFRQRFPEFAGASDEALQLSWDISTAYISPADYGWLNGDTRVLALQLMTAHMAFVSSQAGGSIGGPTQSSSIDKISVTKATIPAKSGFQWFLFGSKYGVQLNALLSAVSVGGLYVSNLPETTAFRKFGGIF